MRFNSIPKDKKNYKKKNVDYTWKDERTKGKEGESARARKHKAPGESTRNQPKGDAS